MIGIRSCNNRRSFHWPTTPFLINEKQKRSQFKSRRRASSLEDDYTPATVKYNFHPNSHLPLRSRSSSTPLEPKFLIENTYIQHAPHQRIKELTRRNRSASTPLEPRVADKIQFQQKLQLENLSQRSRSKSNPIEPEYQTKDGRRLIGKWTHKSHSYSTSMQPHHHVAQSQHITQHLQYFQRPRDKELAKKKSQTQHLPQQPQQSHHSQHTSVKVTRAHLNSTPKPFSTTQKPHQTETTQLDQQQLQRRRLNLRSRSNSMPTDSQQDSKEAYSQNKPLNSQEQHLHPKLPDSYSNFPTKTTTHSNKMINESKTNSEEDDTNNPSAKCQKINKSRLKVRSKRMTFSSCLPHLFSNKCTLNYGQ